MLVRLVWYVRPMWVRPYGRTVHLDIKLINMPLLGFIQGKASDLLRRYLAAAGLMV